MIEEIKDQNNKFSIGMYVRTKKGIIGKYNVIKEFANVPTFNGFYETKETEKEYIDDKPFRNYDIKKASFKIIDLIEEGDYVNGREIIDIKMKCDKTIKCLITKGYDITNEMIKSIVTKEQFKSMEYIVKK